MEERSSDELAGAEDMFPGYLALHAKVARARNHCQLVLKSNGKRYRKMLKCQRVWKVLNPTVDTPTQMELSSNPI